MHFDRELELLKGQIERAQDMDELNYIRLTNEKKYWWTSIFVAGLFYALNGDVGKMIITWILSLFTLGIYALYIIYTSYRDQEEFNNQMEYYILQKSKELKGNPRQSSYTSPSQNQETLIPENTFECPDCGYELNESLKFCPNCGKKVEPPEEQINFCTECGAKIRPEAKFCHECGNLLKEDDVPVEQMAQIEHEEVPQLEESEVIQLPGAEESPDGEE